MDIWSEIRRRQAIMGSKSIFRITSDQIECTASSWQDVPAHSFCLLLSFNTWYNNWARMFGRDYTEQGELFELLTKESLESQFPGWKIHQTGWSKTNPVKLPAVVDRVAELLGEVKGNVDIWAEPNANEAGLDLLGYRPFDDGRVGVPVYLIQCASGANWREKLRTPDLTLWRRIILFAAEPKRAFSTPFSFLNKDFQRNCGTVDGMLLDRYRLLAATNHKKHWPSSSLKRRILAWAAPRATKLPIAQ